MSFADSFERRFLFVLTRGLALLFIFGLLAAIVIGGVMVSDKLSLRDSTEVSPQEVVNAIKPPPSEELQPPTDSNTATPVPPPDPAILPGIKLPFVLQKHFNVPDRIQTLRGWLEGLPSGQRQAFLDEMAAAVVEAEKAGADGLDAVNKYKEIKYDKLKQEEAAAAALATARLTYAGVAFGAVLLIALFSLILVLLAIERNTRRGQA